MTFDKNSYEKQHDNDQPKVADTAAAPISSPKKDDKPFTSIGYKAHNELTYRGADWFLNAVFGVGFAYAANRTPIGKKFFSGPITAKLESGLTKAFGNEAVAKEGAHWGMTMISVVTGGSAIIPLVTTLEKKENKKAIIHKIDEKYYGKDVVENDPRFKEQDKRIDSEPKKDFSTGMYARVAALLPIFAVTATPTLNRPFEKFVYNPISKGSKALSESLGLVSEKMLKEGEMVVKNKKPQFVNNWDYLHHTIGYDFGGTIFYSILHEIAYKSFASYKYNYSSENEPKAESAIAHDAQPKQSPDTNIELSSIHAAAQRGVEHAGGAL